MIKRKMIVLIACLLLTSTVLASVVIADDTLSATRTSDKPLLVPWANVKPDSRTGPNAISIKEFFTIDPTLSKVELTNEPAGLTTCPKGDGPAYSFLKVTVLNKYDLGIPRIHESRFHFILTPIADTEYYRELSCTFITFGPSTSNRPGNIMTNMNGEILFKIVGDTSIIGSVQIEVVIDEPTTDKPGNNEVPLIQKVALPCKSFDLNVDGVVDCNDYDRFIHDYKAGSGWMSDFNWNGHVDEYDYKMFQLHLEGPCSPEPPETPETPVIPYDGSGGGPNPNRSPIADLSAGEPYRGYVNEALQFDASRSRDNDGFIRAYEWTFGDGTTGTGIKPTHTYTQVGSYIVTLKVTDDDHNTDTATTSALIRGQNQRPLLPTLTGPVRGHQKTEYSYTFTSVDPEEDLIRYYLSWGDDTSSISPFFRNQRIIETSHSWSTPGFYDISVSVEDVNKAMSDVATLPVWIDVWKVKSLGYLINNDGSGPFDVFYTYQTANTTVTEQQNSSIYLLDSDSDGKWNYMYNINTDELLPYKILQQQDYTLMIILTMLIGLFLIMFYFLSRRRKEKAKGAAADLQFSR